MASRNYSVKFSSSGLSALVNDLKTAGRTFDQTLNSVQRSIGKVQSARGIVADAATDATEQFSKVAKSETNNLLSSTKQQLSAWSQSIESTVGQQMRSLRSGFPKMVTFRQENSVIPKFVMFNSPFKGMQTPKEPDMTAKLSQRDRALVQAWRNEYRTFFTQFREELRDELKDIGQKDDTLGLVGRVISTPFNLVGDLIKFPIEATLLGVFSGFGEKLSADFGKGFTSRLEKGMGLSLEAVGEDVGDIVGTSVYRTYEASLKAVRQMILSQSPDKMPQVGELIEDIKKILLGSLLQSAAVPLKAHKRIQINKKALPQVMNEAGNLLINQTLAPEEVASIEKQKSITLLVGGVNNDPTAGNTDYVNRLLKPLVGDSHVVPVKNFWSNSKIGDEFKEVAVGLIKNIFSNDFLAGGAVNFLKDQGFEKTLNLEHFKGLSLDEQDKFIAELIKFFESGKLPFGRLLESAYQGFNPDDIMIAAQALYYKQNFPDKPLNIVGTSGGGFNVAGAIEMLNKLGYKDIKGVGITTPFTGLEFTGNREDFYGSIGTKDPYYQMTFGSVLKGLLEPPDFMQIAPGVGSGHLLASYVGTPEFQNFFQYFFRDRIKIPKGMDGGAMNYISRRVQNPEDENLQRTLLQAFGVPTDAGYTFNAFELAGLTAEIKKKASRIKDKNIKKEAQTFIDFLETLAEELKIISLVGAQFKPLKSLSIAAKVYPELKELAAKNQPSTQDKALEDAVKGQLEVNSVFIQFKAKVKSEAANIKRTLQALRGEKVEGYAFYDEAEYETRANDHLGGLIGHLENDLLKGATPKQQAKAYKYIDYLKRLQEAILAKGKGGVVAPDLYESGQNLFQINLGKYTNIDYLKSLQAKKAQDLKLATDYSNYLEHIIQSVPVEKDVASSGESQVTATIETIKTRMREYREAIANSQHELAKNLGETLLSDIEAAKAVAESSQTGALTRYQNEILRGDKGKGRAQIGLTQLAQNHPAFQALLKKKQGESGFINPAILGLGGLAPLLPLLGNPVGAAIAGGGLAATALVGASASKRFLGQKFPWLYKDVGSSLKEFRNKVRAQNQAEVLENFTEARNATIDVTAIPISTETPTPTKETPLQQAQRRIREAKFRTKYDLWDEPFEPKARRSETSNKPTFSHNLLKASYPTESDPWDGNGVQRVTPSTERPTSVPTNNPTPALPPANKDFWNIPDFWNGFLPSKTPVNTARNTTNPNPQRLGAALPAVSNSTLKKLFATIEQRAAQEINSAQSRARELIIAAIEQVTSVMKQAEAVALELAVFSKEEADTFIQEIQKNIADSLTDAQEVATSMVADAVSSSQKLVGQLAGQIQLAEQQIPIVEELRSQLEKNLASFAFNSSWNPVAPRPQLPEKATQKQRKRNETAVNAESQVIVTPPPATTTKATVSLAEIQRFYKETALISLTIEEITKLARHLSIELKNLNGADFINAQDRSVLDGLVFSQNYKQLLGEPTGKVKNQQQTQIINNIRARMRQFKEAIANGQHEIVESLSKNLLRDIESAIAVAQEVESKASQLSSTPQGANDIRATQQTLIALLNQYKKQVSQTSAPQNTTHRSSNNTNQQSQAIPTSSPPNRSQRSTDNTRPKRWFDRIFDTSGINSTLDEGLGRIFESFSQFFEELEEQFPIIGRFKGVIADLAVNLLALFGVFTAADVVIRFTQVVLEVTRKFEQLDRVIVAGSGSASKGAANLRFVASEAKRLNIDLAAAKESYAQLLVATQGTPLEGEPSRQLFSAFSQYAITKGLDTEKQQRAIAAFSQMLGKNRLYSEEVFGQLGEIPGVTQTLAASLGVTVQQLRALTETGQLAATDVFPKLAAQMAAESNGSVASSADTAQASITRFNNALTEFQVAMGQNLQPAQKLGLNTLAAVFGAAKDAADQLVQVLIALILLVGVRLVDAFMKSVAAGRLAALGITSLKDAFLKALPAIKQFLAEMFLLTAAIQTWVNVYQLTQDSFKDIGEYANASAKGLDNLARAYREAGKAASEMPKPPKRDRDLISRSNIFGFNLDTMYRKPLDGLFGLFGGSFMTQGAREYYDYLANAGDLMQRVRQNNLQADNSKSVVADIQKIDKQLEAVRSKRFELLPGDRSGLAKSIEDEQKLLAEREKLLKITSTISSNFARDAENIKKTIEAIDRLPEGADTDQVRSDLEQALKELTFSQNAFDNLINSVSRGVSELDRRMRNLNEGMAAFNEQLERNTSQSKTDLINQGIQQGRDPSKIQFDLQRYDASALSLKISKLSQDIAQIEKDLASPAMAETVKNLGIDPNTVGSEQLTRMLGEGRSPQEQSALKAIQQLKSNRQQLATAQEQLANSSLQLQSTFKEFTLQLVEYYRQLWRQFEDLGVETKRAIQDLQQAYNNTVLEIESTSQSTVLTNLKTALSQPLLTQAQRLLNGTNDAFEQYLNSLMGGLEKMFEAAGLDQQLKQQIEAINQNITSLSTAQEDRTRQWTRMTQDKQKEYTDMMRGSPNETFGGNPTGNNSNSESILPVPKSSPPPAASGELPPAPNAGGSVEKSTTMTASWYGADFAGRKTANGELFDPNQMTAAHKTLPFGTMLRVTNPSNGEAVVVKINDRGPFIEGRDLDLSQAAARAIGLEDRGTGKVIVELSDDRGGTSGAQKPTATPSQTPSSAKEYPLNDAADIATNQQLPETVQNAIASTEQATLANIDILNGKKDAVTALTVAQKMLADEEIRIDTQQRQNQWSKYIDEQDLAVEQLNDSLADLNDKYLPDTALKQNEAAVRSLNAEHRQLGRQLGNSTNTLKQQKDRFSELSNIMSGKVIPYLEEWKSSLEKAGDTKGAASIQTVLDALGQELNWMQLQIPKLTKSITEYEALVNRLPEIKKRAAARLAIQLVIGQREEELNKERTLIESDNSVLDARGNFLQSQGDEFGANRILKQKAIAEENLRYRQQLLDIDKQVAENPTKFTADEVDGLRRNAEDLNRVNLQNIQEQFKDLGQVIEAETQGALTQFFEDIFTNTKSVGDAFRDMALSILKSIARIAAQQVVLNIFGKANGASDGFRGLFGKLLGHAEGGLVTGEGTGTSDSIVRRLSNGEFVLRAAAVKHWGTGFLSDLNAMRQPQLAYSFDGGRGDRGNSRGVSNPTLIVNVTSPDVNSFRRSESQVGREAGELYRRSIMRNG